MTSPAAGTSKVIASKADVPARTTRSGKLIYEKPENRVGQAGTSSVSAMPNPLQASIRMLAVPVDPSEDLALTRAQLEEQRQSFLHEAT